MLKSKKKYYFTIFFILSRTIYYANVKGYLKMCFGNDILLKRKYFAGVHVKHVRISKLNFSKYSTEAFSCILIQQNDFSIQEKCIRKIKR